MLPMRSKLPQWPHKGDETAERKGRETGCVFWRETRPPEVGFRAFGRVQRMRDVRDHLP